MKNAERSDHIRKMADAELDQQLSRAHNIAYGESFGSDHEARIEALQWYRTLARERERRKRT